MRTPIHTVERLNWRRHERHWLLVPGTDPLATLRDRDEADQEARDLEWAVRRRVNPFHCGGPLLHYQTSFDAARLVDWCLDAGLEPPALTSESAAWAEWWHQHHHDLSATQQAHVWEALDRVRFFRVASGAPGQPLHLVALSHQENDPVDWPFRGFGQYVGCTPYMLVGTSTTADQLCHELYLNHLARQGGYIGNQPAPTNWVLPPIDPLAAFLADTVDVPNVPFAERRRLSLFAERPPTPGQTLYVVLRRHWRLHWPEHEIWRWMLTWSDSCGVPLAAFATLADADAYQARLEAEARSAAAPFRFGPPHEWGTLHPSALWGVLSELAPIDFTSQWDDYKAQDSLWTRWWDAVAPTLSPLQIETVWSLYDRLRFYEIVEVEYRE